MLTNKKAYRCRWASHVTKVSGGDRPPLPAALPAIMPSCFVWSGFMHMFTFVYIPCVLTKASSGNRLSLASTLHIYTPLSAREVWVSLHRCLREAVCGLAIPRGGVWHAARSARGCHTCRANALRVMLHSAVAHVHAVMYSLLRVLSH